MSEKTTKIKIVRASERKSPSLHPLYYAFCNAKSAAIEIARRIAQESPQQVSPDIRRFLDEFERKTV